MNRMTRQVLARSGFTMSLFLMLLLIMVLPPNMGNPGQLVIIMLSLFLNVCFIGYLFVSSRRHK